MAHKAAVEAGLSASWQGQKGQRALGEGGLRGPARPAFAVALRKEATSAADRPGGRGLGLASTATGKALSQGR